MSQTWQFFFLNGNRGNLENLKLTYGRRTVAALIQQLDRSTKVDSGKKTQNEDK